MKGVILLGHGSRDPLWRLPIEAVARRIEGRAPALLVRCAYLDLDSPDLAAAAADLVAAGARSVTVVPMFLGTGRHVRDDLPALTDGVRASHPGVDIELRPPVGEDSRVLDLLAALASE
ncbi:CbiX/SirB N-terminal domain-containing protein [Ramlibacter solisilvae]|uniref:Cobalamin biosynthesis protein CbiX n=1 Tax=Ramlibacter tataouinensis TaxID=94132 RepID=A0A127JYJ6_9BURK|nr:CbiX/SirB N-terminal domain-containing protein [Ramlibacter tataouinensis]AMO24965.1 cobalamin biosynthesis protein CbiX [Ramlibacter tataouinensis]